MKNSIYTLIIIVAMGFVVTSIISAAGVDDIDFPVAELGNCGSEEECHAYCEVDDHILQCVDFAVKHDLMSPEEAEYARNFAQIGRGPGQCRNRVDCEAYCEDVTNIRECLDFAREHNIMSDQDIEEAEQIEKLLSEGVNLPGNCKSERECQAYCEDGNNIQECVTFAERAGFLEGEELEEAKKMIEFISRGETPGGCTNRGQCEDYCRQDRNMDECVAFFEKSGLIDREELELIKKTGGKGPGGCQSREECENYCNQPENSDQCFAFAKEHGLIDEDDLRHAEEDFSWLRDELPNMPPEVSRCIRESLGEENFRKIENGSFAPGLVTGDAIRMCFDKHGPSSHDMPPEVRQCFVKLYGKDVFDRIQNGELDATKAEERVRDCVADLFEEQNLGRDGRGDRLPFGPNDFPPEAIECIKEKMDSDMALKIGRGERVDMTPEQEEIMGKCVSQFLPHDFTDHGEFEDPLDDEHDRRGSNSNPGSGFDRPQLNFPPEVMRCLHDRFGDNFGNKVATGEITRGAIEGVAADCFQQIEIDRRSGIPAEPINVENKIEFSEDKYRGDIRVEERHKDEFVEFKPPHFNGPSPEDIERMRREGHEVPDFRSFESHVDFSEPNHEEIEARIRAEKEAEIKRQMEEEQRRQIEQQILDGSSFDSHQPTSYKLNSLLTANGGAVPRIMTNILLLLFVNSQ